MYMRKEKLNNATKETSCAICGKVLYRPTYQKRPMCLSCEGKLKVPKLKDHSKVVEEILKTE